MVGVKDELGVLGTHGDATLILMYVWVDLEQTTAGNPLEAKVKPLSFTLNVGFPAPQIQKLPELFLPFR